MPLPRLFPPADQGAALRTAIALTPVDGALPVVSWLGPTRGVEPGALRRRGSRRLRRWPTHGPGMPLLGEHARGRYTRPHLRGHRLRTADDSETGGAWSTWFRPVAEEHDDRRLVVTAVDEHCRARSGRRAGDAGRRLAAGPVHGHQPGPGRLRRRRSRGGAPAARRPRRGARLHRASRARAQPAAAHRHRRAVAARGPGRAPRSGLGHHGRRRHPRLRDDPRCAWSASTSPGAATRCCGWSGPPPAAPPSVAASTCCPER